MCSRVPEPVDDIAVVHGWVEQTALFRTWASMKQEILLHKWYESERAGRDIGWEKAAVDWMVRYGCQRRNQRPTT
jgi:hypothetical protein